MLTLQKTALFVFNKEQFSSHSKLSRKKISETVGGVRKKCIFAADFRQTIC